MSSKQYSAVELHVQGKSDREVAAAVGVHRVTVTRWRLYDVLYQAELNARRRELTRMTSDYVLQLRLETLATIRLAVHQGDVPTALKFFLATSEAGEHIGPDAPDVLEWEWARREEATFRRLPGPDDPKRALFERWIDGRRQILGEWEAQLAMGRGFLDEAKQELQHDSEQVNLAGVLGLEQRALGKSYVALRMSDGEGILSLTAAEQSSLWKNMVSAAEELDRLGLRLQDRADETLEQSELGRWVDDLAEATRILLEVLKPRPEHAAWVQEELNQAAVENAAIRQGRLERSEDMVGFARAIARMLEALITAVEASLDDHGSPMRDEL